MKTWLKRLTLCFGAVLALLALVSAAGWWRTQQTLALRWQLPPAGIAYTATPERIARGEHLARSRGCAGCHGETLAGKHLTDAGPVIQVHTPNLTRGGVLPQLDIVAFEHAVRHGVGREGRPLLVPASFVPASFVPASLVPASSMPPSLVPASFAPASFVPASGTPASGTPASGTPASGAPASTTVLTYRYFARRLFRPTPDSNFA